MTICRLQFMDKKLVVAARIRITSGLVLLGFVAAAVGIQADPVAASSVISNTYEYTGETDTFTVPDGVTSMTVTLKGGQGGLGGRDSQGSPIPGGYQGVVTGVIAVTPGDVVTVAVGGGGGEGESSAGNAYGGYPGDNPLSGYDGAFGGVAGPEGSSGGGGGSGAASVLQIGNSQIVAGGAGGNGGNGQFEPIVGRRAEDSHIARPDETSTTGRPGIDTWTVCSEGFRCDGGASGAGGGGAQGGDQGAVQYGGDFATEYFGFGGYPGSNSTAGFAGLTESYDYYEWNSDNGSITISYDDGAPGAPLNLAGTAETGAIALTWNAPSANGSSAISDYLIEYANDPESPFITFDDGISAAVGANVTGLDNGVTYFFRVTAINSQGPGAAALTSLGIVPSDVPAPPTVDGLTSLAAGILVDFTPGSSDSEITGYDYRLDAGGWAAGSVAGNQLTISGLTNGHTYSVEIRARNIIGAGDPSTPAQTATPLDVPLSPTSLLAAAGNGSVALNWVAPTVDNGSPITDYVVQTAATIDGTYETFVDDTSTSTSSTVTGLNNGATYYLRVAAVNAVGIGAWSSSTVATPYTSPNAPSIAVTPGDGSLAVEITPSFDGGSAVTAYEYRLGVGGAWKSTGALLTNFTIAGLANATSYGVFVRAINAAGPSPASNIVAGTPRTVPSAPAISTVALDTGAVNVSFIVGSNGGSALTNIEYSINGGSTWVTRSPASIVSPVTIDGLVGGVTYPIRLRVVNAAGFSAGSNISSVTVKGAPDAPVISVASADRALVVTFATPGNGGTPITNYEYSVDDGDSWSLRSPASTSSPIVIGNLLNGVTYPVQVRAVNAAGSGASSNTVLAVPQTVPGAPSLDSQSIVGGDGSLDVGFTAPSSDGGSAITNYQYSTDAGATWRDRQSGSTASPLHITTLSSNGTTALAGGTIYRVEIRAVNAVGHGVASAVATGITTTVPDAPLIVSADSRDSSAAIHFTPPANGGATIIRFEYRLDGSVTWTDTGSLADEFVVSGLVNSTTYTFEMRAVNSVNPGPASAPRFIQALTTPGAPVLGAIVPGDRTLSVGFTAPSSNGGSPITGYQYSTDGGATWRTRSSGTTGSPLVITTESAAGAAPLTNATIYATQLRAVNVAGNGAASETELAAPRGTPSAPTAVSLAAGDGTLVFTFTAGADGGSPITAIEYQLNGVGGWTDPTSLSSPLTVAGLNNGVSYSIAVRARNAVGTSDASAALTATPRTVPGAPTGVQATIASHQVTVSWLAPVFNGGAAIVGYTVSLHDQATGGTLIDTCITNGALTCAVTGLTNGTTVYVDVVAENAASVGSASDPRLARTPLGTPQVTIGSIITGATDFSVAVNVVDNGGAPITAFEYQLDGGSWTTAPTATSPFTISGLTTGHEYSVRIRAIGAGGTGEASPLVTAVPHTAPPAPSSLSVVSADASAVLSWTAPTSNGGQPITDYAVQYATSVAGPFTTFVHGTSTTTAATVTGLTNATNYVFRVAAVNNAGTGSWSALASATPLGTPSAPFVYWITPGSRFLQVWFDDPLSDGGSPVTGYEYRLDGGAWHASSATSAPFTITGLSNGQTYAVEIRAVNVVGGGTASNVMAEKPYGRPAAVIGFRATPSGNSVTLEWDAVNDNGSPVTDYNVIRWSDLVEGYIVDTFHTTETSAVFDYLDDGIYFFTIEATNLAGTGPRSAPRTTSIVGGTVPSAPSVQLTSVVGLTASMDWTRGDAGSSPITGYLVQYSTDDTIWISVSYGSDASTATFDVPSTSTPYELRVASISAVGVGTFTTVRPPLAVTGAVSTLGTTSAAIGGSANARGGNVDVAFELATAAQGFGTTTSTTVPATPATASGATDTPVSTNLIGLSPGTAWVTRTVVTADGFISRGVSRTFNTDATIVSFGLTPIYTGLPAVVNSVTGPADLALERVYEGVDSTVYPSSSTPPTAAGTYSVTTIPANHGIGGVETVGLTILPKPLTVSVTVADRPYDGTTSAELVLGLVGAIEGDDVDVDASHLSGAFEDAAAGVDKVVHVTAAGALLTGADAANYAPVISDPVLATIQQATQSLAFTSSPPTPAAVGSTYVPVAVSTMALTPSFAIGEESDGICSLSNGTVDLLSPGTCVVVASQDGNADVEAADAVEQSFTVVLARVPQTITFEGLHDTQLDAAAPVLSAVTTDNLPLAYSAGPSTVCTVAGVTISLHGLGRCTISADQAGDSTHLSATATASFAVTAIAQIVATLRLDAGGDVADATVMVSGSSLKPFSEVRIELHPAGVLLGTQTTDASGAFETTVRIPNVVSPGTHSIVASGVRPDGRPITASEEFFVDWSGSLGDLQTSGGYTPLTATRILDTRESGSMTAATEVRLVVPATLVPADVSSLVLNLTITDAERSGFLTVYPCGSTRPLAAAINFTAGETKANLVDALFRSGGQLCLWSNVDVDAVIDLQGFHSTSGEGRLVPRTAVRLVDTRPDHALVAGQVLQIPVTGAGKAPDGTTTVTLNVAVDDPRRAGFLTVYPCGTDRPWASNLNFVSGQTVSNEVMVQPGTDGMVCVYTTAATHLVVDLDATYEASGLEHFTALVPGRFADTRLTARVLAGQAMEWAVVGDGGAPIGTTALSLNVAVTEPEGAGFLTVYPCGTQHAVGVEPQLRQWTNDQQPRHGHSYRGWQDLRVRQPHHQRGGRHRGHVLARLIESGDGVVCFVSAQQFVRHPASDRERNL